MQEPNNHCHRRIKGSRNGGHPKSHRPLTITAQPRETSIRLFCDTSIAGGVIGRSGTVVKRLEEETGAKIIVKDPVPGCNERVIEIVGLGFPKKIINLKGEDEENEEACEVSIAQEGILRVFERLLELKKKSVPGGRGGGGGGDRTSCCRLLAHTSQIGRVMGKGGNTIHKIAKNSGAKIRVLPTAQKQALGFQTDELIQIWGGVLAVKKALVAVSSCLQDCPPLDDLSSVVCRSVGPATYGTFPDPHDPHMECYRQLSSTPSPLPGDYAASHGVFPDPHAEFFPNLSSLSLSLPDSGDSSSSGHSLPTSVDGISSIDAKSIQLEVVFRLLFPNSLSGGLIGKGGAIIRTLQNESGATINLAPATKCVDRVVTISALENSDSIHSPAQIAVVRVFARSVEVGIENGLVRGITKRESETARLLIESKQVAFLMDKCIGEGEGEGEGGGEGESGSIISDIMEVTGAHIQMLILKELSECALETDEVLQITGEYKSVQKALLQVTGRLRDNCFLTKALKGVGVRSYTSSMIPDLIPFGRQWETPSPVLHQSLAPSPNLISQESIPRGMNHLPVSHNFGNPSSPSLKMTQNLARGNRISAIITNTTVEVLVPAHVFKNIYGKDGNNLERLRQISGAQVTVQVPLPGKNEGKVIISGAPDQIVAAESLIQAFLLA